MEVFASEIQVYAKKPLSAAELRKLVTAAGLGQNAAGSSGAASAAAE